MKFADTKPYDEYYEYFNTDTQKRIIFNVSQLWDFAETHPDAIEAFTTPIEPWLAEHFEKNCGIEEQTVSAIDERRLNDPILAVLHSDGTTITVDGHHRYVQRFRKGKTDVKMVRVKLGQWEWCDIEDWPEVLNQVDPAKYQLVRKPEDETDEV